MVSAPLTKSLWPARSLVVSQVAEEVVLAFAGVEDVVVIAAVDFVVAVLAQQRVVAEDAVEAIVALLAVHDVDAEMRADVEAVGGFRLILRVGHGVEDSLARRREVQAHFVLVLGVRDNLDDVFRGVAAGVGQAKHFRTCVLTLLKP